jgi:hypothetical protein
VGPVSGTRDAFLEQVRVLSTDLTRAETMSTDVTVLAARLLAIDPAAEGLQRAAGALMHSADADARRLAIAGAQSALLQVVRSRVGPPVRADVRTSPLQGYLAEELLRAKGTR